MKKTTAPLFRRITNSVLFATFFALATVAAHAANGTYINTASGGSWSTTGNWASGIIANGAGFSADFASINITADNTVHLDSARTLTGLIFGDSNTGSAAGWTLDNSGNSGNILTLSSSVITVNTLGGTKVATVSVILAGSSSLTKNGSGTLVLSAPNTYTGNTTISAGRLALSGSGAIDSSPIIFVASGTSFNVLAGGYTVSAGHVLTGAGTVSGGTVTVTNGGVLSPGSAGIGTLILSSLSLSSGSTNNFEFTGTGTNDLVVATNLTINGGSINLFQAGTTTPFTNFGTYNLFQYSGFVGGGSSTVLSVANPQPGIAYIFGDTGTNITITINALTPPPVRISAYSVDGSILAVHFSEQVQTPSCLNPANYTIYTKSLSSSGVNVTNATLLSDEQTVVLRVDAPVSEFYAVGVSNVLDFSSNNVVANYTSYLGDWTSTSIGTGGDPATVGDVTAFYRDAMQITANGSDIGGTNDHCHYVYDKISGNFEAVADFTRLDFTDRETKACIMARDSVATGSRIVAVGFTPIVPGVSTNRVVMLARTNSNGAAFAFGDPPQLNDLGWLRLTRTNSIFRAYYGTNGLDWIACGALTNGTFSTTMHVGVAVTSHTNGHDTAAAVNSLGVAGDRAGTGVVPTLSINIRSNILVASWQRTPRDFALQFTGNMSASPGSSNSPVWAYMMLPVFDTALTGTNNFMTTPGRYMTIPLNSLPSPAFVRLTQVERVIPDPIGVSPGLVLSQSAGDLAANNPGTKLGTYTVNPTNAVYNLITNYLVLSPLTNYTLTTTVSTNLRTVMLLNKVLVVNNNPTPVAVTTDAGLKNSGQAMISLLGTATNYTVIIAATNKYTPTASNPLQLRIDF